MKARAATLFALGLAHAALAQAAEQPAGVDDVIVVNGVRHPLGLRLQMLDAELRVYDLFNQFNDDQQFTIECSRRAFTGTRLQSQVCQPVFERHALTLEAQDYLAAYRAYMDAAANGGGFNASGGSSPLENYSPIPSAPPAASIIGPKQRRLQQKMRTIAEEHPEFTEALVEYVNLKVQYGRATIKVDE